MDEKNSPDQSGSDESTAEQSSASSSPPTPANPAWWTGRRRWLGLAAAGVAVAVIAALVVTAVSDNERERLVRDLLTASRDGEVEEAMDLMGENAISGAESLDGDEPDTSFLVSEAAHTDWEILNVEERGGARSSSSTVEVEVSDPNGTQHSTELELENADGEWRFRDGLPTVAFPDSGLWYAELNGFTVPAEEETNELGFAVLPGFYRSFSDPPEGVETSATEQFLFPGDVATPEETGPKLTLTEGSEARIREEVETLVDDCIEDADLHVLDCPLGVDRIFGLRDEEDRRIEPEEFNWEVTQYPDVAAFPTTSGILVSDRVRGTAELTVEGTYTEGGGSAEVTHTCEIRTQVLEAGFDPEGEVHLRPRGHRYEAWDELALEYPVNLVDCR